MRQHLLVLPAVVGLVAAGCATVRQAREAQDPRRVPAGERTVTAAEAGLTSNTVLTLERAVRLALICHPSVTVARQNLVAASNTLAAARSARGPTVSADAGYRRGTGNTPASRGSHTANDSYSAGLSAIQLLYDFGRTAASIRRAEYLLAAAAEQMRAAVNDAAYVARVAFLELGRTQETLAVAEETERQYLKRLEQVQGLAEVGRRIKYDITKAEVDLGNARLSLINARNAVADARATLMRAMGLAEDPACRIAETTVREYAGMFEDRLAVARLRQPELCRLRAEQGAAAAGLDESVADLYPSFSLGGEYLLTGNALPLLWNWAANARFGWTLFNNGKTRAAVASSVAELRAARARVADREQQLVLDLRTAFTHLQTARERRGLTTLIVRQARENLDLVSERYRLGQASSVELTDAQAAFTQARGDEVNARFDYQSAVAAIVRATGEEER